MESELHKVNIHWISKGLPMKGKGTGRPVSTTISQGLWVMFRSLTE